jgi:hypothetical protein
MGGSIERAGGRCLGNLFLRLSRLRGSMPAFLSIGSVPDSAQKVSRGKRLKSNRDASIKSGRKTTLKSGGRKPDASMKLPNSLKSR